MQNGQSGLAQAQIHTVGVIGAGAMGSGIATALLLAGLRVLLQDITLAAATAGKQRIQKTLQGRVAKGSLAAAEAEALLANIALVTDYEGFEQVDLVIEAAAEDITIKHAIFKKLDAITPAHAILATNTSSLSITWIAAATARADRVVGMHFFNPAHVMKLVEIVPGLETSVSTVDSAIALGTRLGKLAVRVEECASFLVNRLLGRYGGEALYILQDGIAGPEAIDAAAVALGMPMGPITLRDFTGVDIGHAVASFNFQEYGERFAPPPLLAAMKQAGHLGQKTLQGFYVYDPQTRAKQGVNPELSVLLERFPKHGDAFDPRRIFLTMINEAFYCLQERVVAADQLDAALRAGLGMKKGPLEMAESFGLSTCLELLEALFRSHGERFRPAPLLKRMVWAGRTRVVG